MPTPATTPRPPQSPRPPRRARRWAIRLGILALLLAGAWLLLTRSFVTRALVLSQVGAILGGDLSAASLTIDSDGHVEAAEISLRARGVTGPAGEVLHIARLEADVDLWSVIRGSPEVRGLTLVEPLARISQSVDDDTLNLAALSPREMKGSRPKSFPRVLIRQGVVELGEHITDPRRLVAGEPAFRALRQIPVSGEVERAPGEQGAMSVSFRELDATGQPLAGPGGLQIQGDISEDHVTLNLGVISLATWSADSLPASIRQPFRDLALEGLVYGAQLTYTNARGVEAHASLSDVAITLPVETQPDVDSDGNQLPLSPGDKGRRLRMQRVSGDITVSSASVRADLIGIVEELPYRVQFESPTASADAPFTCKVQCDNFRMETRPQVLRFAPGLVRHRLQQFSDPTGLVDVEVDLRRGAPVGGVAAPVEVQGILRFRDATAAFERFPYRFTGMTGEFAFTDNRIDIRKIIGTSPGGASVEATGSIHPLTDDANVNVTVQVRGLPIDAALGRAMQARGRIVDELCNAAAYDALVRQGLITPSLPGARAPTPDAPVFELGGRVDVLAVVTRVPGEENPWHDTITITMPRVGILPRSVPLPMIARDVTIIKQDDTATVKGGRLEGLQGGHATLTATADLRGLTDDSIPFSPEVQVAARNIPLTRLLLSALSADPSAAEIAHAALATRPAGLLDIDASVTAAPSYRVEVRSADAAIAPPPFQSDGAPPARAQARHIRGALVITPDAVTLDLEGQVLTPDAQPQGDFTLALRSLRGELVKGERGPAKELRIDVAATAAVAAFPAEDFIAPFASEAAADLAALRAEKAFEGRWSGTASVLRRDGADPSLTLTVTRAEDLSLLTPGGRLGLTTSSGDFTLTRAAPSAPSILTFHAWQGTLAADGLADGSCRLDGPLTTEGLPAGAPLTVALTSSRCESPVVRWLAVRSIPGAASAIADTNPRGLFDLDLTLTPAPESAWDATGVLTPRALTLHLGSRDTALASPSGRIEFSPGRGQIREFSFSGPGPADWSGTLRGGWITNDDRSRAAHAELALRSGTDPSTLLEVLPAPLRAAFTDLQLHAAGPVTLDPLKLSLNFTPAGDTAAFSISGTAAVDDLALDPGVPITRAKGSIEFSAQRDGPAASTSFELWGLFDSLAANGVSLTGARIRVAGDGSGRVLIPHFSGACHGGRFAGEADVSPPDAQALRTFATSTQLSGVRFASVLAELTASDGAEPIRAGDEATPDGSRGILDASFTLSGTVSRPDTRQGRGTGSLTGGRVMSLPLLVPLIRVSNLELPLDERLDFARADFFVQGPYLNFEELSVFSRSVEVLGFGTMRWPDTALDLRFRPKARTRIPILTPILEGVRNELVGAEVQGTLRQPEVKFTTLGGTTRFIGLMFGDKPGEQQRRLEDIERRAASREQPAPRDSAPITSPK